jgi:hypothetical protein
MDNYIILKYHNYTKYIKMFKKNYKWSYKEY